MHLKNLLLGLITAAFFSLLYVLGVFGHLGNQVYDLFLRFRPDRERSKEIVFLDVDDNAVAFNGVFPWPRSVMADGLLRLKEYGARAAIFDIEYIDKGPAGVDTVYMSRGLPADFNRVFTGIDAVFSDAFSALVERRISLDHAGEYATEISSLIRDEQRSLLAKASGIARDNDLYLIQSSALFGKTWATVNLRSMPLEDEEQAGRRPIAEERFSYPVTVLPGAGKGKHVDILPALPGFALAAAGAGFTNVEIDGDGVRRRIYLAQNIHDHWYLQLAFAPLVHYLGNPEIELSSRRLLMKNARMPGGATKDIAIPLDGQGMMMLDWPKEDYKDSYKHISFYRFSLLEQLEAELEHYARAFSGADIPLFAQFDPSLVRILIISGELEELFNAIYEYRASALEDCSDESFSAYVDFRTQTRNLIRELLNINPGAKANALIPGLVEANPDVADILLEEAEYINSLTEALRVNLDRYEAEKEIIENTVKDKFCILGRVDTGTTDIGSNPFYGEYVNVGTHGVVPDMVLSQTFITPIAVPWRALFAVAFVLLFFFVTVKLAPVPRAALGFLATVLVITASAVLFRYTGYFFNPLLVTFAMVSAVILREIVSYAGSEREKQFIRKAFSTYVSHDVVKEIIADPSRLQLGGTKRHMSAIFTDVKGFSTISEKLDPEQLVSLLNRYLTLMSDVILNEKGTIDKYEGDAIIAFFGAPVEIPDHALRACVSSIAMKRIEEEFNKTVAEEKLSPMPLFTRFGINTGSMVAGNMGTENKMNYTIMGNAVNLAARLEGVNKQYGTRILTSGDTIKETGGRLVTRKLDRVRVVGINEPVRLYEVLDVMESADPQKKKLAEAFEQALEYFEKRDWKAALEGFRESLSLEEDGGPSVKYIKRCEEYQTQPPEDDWDGVFSLTQK